MGLSSNIYNNFYKAILFLLPAFYIFLFGRYGFEGSDGGFLVSLGWRIVNGELPYKDFYYVRPPLSPYLSALFISIVPEYGQIFYIRFITYIMMLLTVLMTTDILSRFYDFKKLNLNTYLFSIISFFILSIGHLEFQWHTTDGIFFAVLGLWLLTLHKDNFLPAFVAGIIFTLSALTKQNFMIIPIFGLLFTLLTYGKKIAVFVSIGIATAFALFYFWLYSHSLTELYAMQTTGVTSIKDLIAAGFVNYFINNRKLFPLVSVISIVLIFIYKFYRKLFTVQFISFFILTMIFLLNLTIPFSKHSSSILFRFDLIFPVLVVFYFVYLLIRKKEKLKDHYVLIYLFSIAWASSISWGYQSPMLYFVPIVFAIIFILSKYYNLLNSRKYNAVFVLLIIAYCVPYSLFPYRDKPIWKLDYSADAISDKSAYIITNKEIISKHKELSYLLQKYPKTTVLPSAPHAYYLNNLKNNFKIDWAMDIEAAYDTDGLIKNINECCEYIIVEKRLFGQPIGEAGKFYSSVTDYVINNFTLVENQNEFFDIYRSEK